jgi:hypothetical protein
MPTTQDYFNDWFRDVLQGLYKNSNAGFVIVITSLTLLERYLREKSGAGQADTLPDAFFEEFLKLFPQIAGCAYSKDVLEGVPEWFDAPGHLSCENEKRADDVCSRPQRQGTSPRISNKRNNARLYDLTEQILSCSDHRD